MSVPLAKDLVNAVREAAEGAVSGALAAFTEAGIATFAQVIAPEFIRTHAHAGADAVADGVGAILLHNMLGAVASDADAKGIRVGAVHVDTRLVAFASGEHVASPIEKITVEHQFPLQLASVGARVGTLSATGTLTLKAGCAFGEASARPKTTTSVDLALEVAWSAEAEKAPVAAETPS